MLKSSPSPGYALVIVIWILTLLSLMAGSFALTMRRDNSVSLALKNNALALALTESGLGLAEFAMQNPDPDQRWLVDGTIYQVLRADGSEIRIRVSSESGKIDLNMASDKLLAAMLKSVTGDLFAEEKLFNTILDWRDADDDVRPHGAEKKQYQEAGLGYGPSNKPFQSLEELQSILGMNNDLYQQLKPLLTVYSGQNNINDKEASPQVLQIYESVNGNTAVQTPSAPAAPAPANGVAALANTNQNSAYTFQVDVLMEDNASASLEAVIKFQPSQAQAQTSVPTQAPNVVQVLDWKQNQLQPSLFAAGMDARLITIQDEFKYNN